MFQDFVTSYLAGLLAYQEELSREKLERVMQAIIGAYEQTTTFSRGT